MRMRSYRKKSSKIVNFTVILENLKNLGLLHKLSFKRMAVVSSLCVLGVILFAGIGVFRSIEDVSIGHATGVYLSSVPAVAASTKTGVISIPSGMVNVNPFVPYKDLGGASELDLQGLSIVEPPAQIDENSDAARVMDTIVSGILYDKYSPSAIINIEGNDYLVKKGDVVNNYKVLDIVRDSVTVKLGSNTYRAGIGEILTEGSLNHNDVSNLNNKFGGGNNGLQ